MQLCVLLLVTLTLALTTAEERQQHCACEERIAALEAKVAALIKTTETQMQHPTDRGHRDMNEELAATGGTHPAATAVNDHGRQLSFSGAAPVYVSVKESRRLHEFPAGHTCPNVGGKYMLELPTTPSGVSWLPSSPSDMTENTTFVSVGSSWSTSTIQSYPEPLRIVHNSDCSSAPAVGVAGQLLVATDKSKATDVGAELSGASLQVTQLVCRTPCPLILRADYSHSTARSDFTPTIITPPSHQLVCSCNPQLLQAFGPASHLEVRS